jgi:hypothetical protein
MASAGVAVCTVALHATLRQRTDTITRLKVALELAAVACA